MRRRKRRGQEPRCVGPRIGRDRLRGQSEEGDEERHRLGRNHQDVAARTRWSNPRVRGVRSTRSRKDRLVSFSARAGSAGGSSANEVMARGQAAARSYPGRTTHGNCRSVRRPALVVHGAKISSPTRGPNVRQRIGATTGSGIDRGTKAPAYEDVQRGSSSGVVVLNSALSRRRSRVRVPSLPSQISCK